MSGPADVPKGSHAVVDSSVRFAMGSPENEKYRAFRRFVDRRELSVRIPEAVAEELGESPDAYADQRDRLRTAREAGWLRRGQIDYGDPDVSKVVDRTRERMASRSAADVDEDDVERADTVLAGLAYQLATGRADHVAVLVSDRLAEASIRDVLSSSIVDDRTVVVEGRSLLEELVDDAI